MITDLQLPGMNEAALTKEIKKVNQALSFILLNPLRSEHKKKFGQLLSGVLAKPVKQQELWRLIQLQFKEKKTACQELGTQQIRLLPAELTHTYPLKF